MYAQTHKHVAQTFLKIPKEMMAWGKRRGNLKFALRKIKNVTIATEISPLTIQ